MATPTVAPDGADGPRGVVVPLRSAEEGDPGWDPSSAFDSENPELQQGPKTLGDSTELPPAALLSYRSESIDVPATGRKIAPAVWIALAIVLIAGAVTAGVLVYRGRTSGAPPSSTTSASPTPSTAAPVAGTGQGAGLTPSTASEGAVTINSAPQGAEVLIDGLPRGTTPVTLAVASGDHVLLLRNGNATRTVTIAVKAGTESSHYIDLPVATSSEATGRLDITSDPPGASVTVDGVKRGVTPLVLASVAPGVRTVVISDGTSSVTRTVRVNAGASAAVLASLTPAGASAGWLAISSPIELQIVEAGRVIGTTAMARLMLPVGKHDLELVNETLQFRTALPVQVTAGKVTEPAFTLPDGALFVNAVPWAEVLIDGRAVGTTPLASLPVPIGRHEITWRHPQFGERKQTIVVTAGAPVRVGIDLRK